MTADDQSIVQREATGIDSALTLTALGSKFIITDTERESEEGKLDGGERELPTEPNT